MRYMVTVNSGWGTLALVLAVGWGQIDLFKFCLICLNITTEFVILETLIMYYCSLSNYKMKKQLIEIVK